MTRKTYQQLAKEIGRLLAIEADTGDRVTWELIGVMCAAMKSDNSAFDKTKFVEAVEAAKKDTIKRWDDRTIQSLTNSIVAGNG
jgi:hypothetical protein